MSTKLFDSFVHDFLQWSKTSVEPKNACPFAKTSRVKNQIQFLDGSSNFDVIQDWDSSKEMGVVYLGQDVDKEIIMEKIYKARANDPSKVFFYTAPIKGIKDNNPFQCIIIHNKKEFMLKQRMLYEKGDYYKNYPEEKLDKFIANENISKKEIQDVTSTIKCKLIPEGEIFISAKQEMWPCCFLWDVAFKNQDNILDKLSEYKTGWNSLKNQDIDTILAHPWFDKILGESWNPNHNKHLKRCIRTCAYNKAYHNEIKVEA